MEKSVQSQINVFAQPALLAIGLKRKVMLSVLFLLLNRLKFHQVFSDEHLA
jgi:hypothetical protein